MRCFNLILSPFRVLLFSFFYCNLLIAAPKNEKTILSDHRMDSSESSTAHPTVLQWPRELSPAHSCFRMDCYANFGRTASVSFSNRQYASTRDYTLAPVEKSLNHPIGIVESSSVMLKKDEVVKIAFPVQVSFKADSNPENIEFLVVKLCHIKPGTYESTEVFTKIIFLDRLVKKTSGRYFYQGIIVTDPIKIDVYGTYNILVRWNNNIFNRFNHFEFSIGDQFRLIQEFKPGL